MNGFGSRVDVNYQYKDYSTLIIPEGFIAHNGQTRFYRNWKMQRGWVDYNDTRYYLDGAGNLVRGWFTDDKGTYYLTPEDGQGTVYSRRKQLLLHSRRNQNSRLGYCRRAEVLL